MHCQRIFFPSFLVVYILTSICLAIGAFFIHIRKDSDNYYGSYVSRPGRYYIGAVSIYILLICIILIIALIYRKKTFIFFRLAIVLLVLGIIFQLLAVALIVFMRDGIDPNTRKTTLIVASSLTCYLVILQIYGAIATLSYLSEIRHRYSEVPSK